jgi:type IV pilus assembly protein PilE
MKPNTRMQARRNRGFSLMELLIAIGIIGILASIAVPSYRDYVRRGQIEEATAALSQGRIAFEQYFLDNRTFAGADTAPTSVCPASTTNFVIACVVNNLGTRYVLSATGAGNLSTFVYNVNELNQRATTSPWGNGACWIMQKGAAC